MAGWRAANGEVSKARGEATADVPKARGAPVANASTRIIVMVALCSACGSSEGSAPMLSEGDAAVGGEPSTKASAGGSAGAGLGLGGAGAGGSGGAGDGGSASASDAGVLGSLSRFDGSPLSETVAWRTEQRLLVDGVHGDIDVTEGASSSIVVTFEPFVFRAFDTAEGAIEEDFALLETAVTTDPSGAVVVSTRRQPDANRTLGANITVELPPSFDAELEILQRNGPTRVDFVGAAPTLTIDSGNGGVDVDTSGAGAVAVTTDNGSVDAAIGSFPGDTAGGRFASGLGNVSLLVPRQGAFSVMAIADREVRTGSLPPECSIAEAAVNSKTLTCNGGGVIYEAEALGIGGTVEFSFY